MNLYLDNSEFYSERKPDIQDIFLMGGIAIDEENEKALVKAMKSIVSQYTIGSYPLKWNFRDLKKFYKKHNNLAGYEVLLDNSKQWRQDLAAAVKDIPFKIILSVVESYVTGKDRLKMSKENLCMYAFNNTLMRFGKEIQTSTNNGKSTVILDWPPSNSPMPFVLEYHHGYAIGKTPLQNLPYHCGSLSKLGFHHTPHFARSEFCQLLQFSDLVVGAAKEFFETAVKGKRAGQGVKFLQTFSPKLRGYPNKIQGRGISIAGDQTFKNQVQLGIQTYLTPPISQAV